MNPWIVVALALSLLAGGFKLGSDHEIASQAKENKQIEKAVAETKTAIADGLAALRPKYTTIQNKLEKEIETHTIYRDCKLSPDGLLLVNQALTGGSVGSGGSELPKADGVEK
jgi:hypothetical protein